MDEQLEQLSSGDNLEVITARADTRDVKVNILLLWKEPIKRILKRRIEDEKKLTISKIVRFIIYRPITIINNNSEKDV